MIIDFLRQNITYKTFRTMFNKETCSDLESVVIHDPDSPNQYICFANKSPSIHDDRIIKDIIFDVVELPKPFKGFGVRATVYLKANYKNKI